MGYLQQAVWRQAGRMSAESLVGFWKFCARASLCETPPDRQAAGRYTKKFFANALFLQFCFF